jgi:CRP-like cAMP-binding protein
MGYDLQSLLQLPLFLGMGRSELADIEQDVQIGDTHARRGTILASENEACTALVLVARGTVMSSTRSDDHSYQIDETLQAPLLIQPEHIFGIKQRYTSTFCAQTYCEVIRIEKPTVLKLMELSMTFRLNLMNIIATQSQRSSRRLWHQMSEDIEKRIIRFIKDRCIYPAGQKQLRTKMTVLARELGCSRLEVSEALHRLEGKQLLIVRRTIIEIPMLQLL